MTTAEFREYVANLQSPAAEAARLILAEYDALRVQVAKLHDERTATMELRAELRDARAALPAYERENERLRLEIDKLHKAEWEADRD